LLGLFLYFLTRLVTSMMGVMMGKTRIREVTRRNNKKFKTRRYGADSG